MPDPSKASRPALGELLREWRAARHFSQLDLALASQMSTRHLSCVETGKARPSRETLARIAAVLDMPLRERNALLLAAGYAPEYPERGWEAPALERMRQAVDLILAHQEPYPAFVLDRQWDVLMANDAALRVNRLLMDGRESRHRNLLHQVFDPTDFRAVIVNWPEVAEKFLHHLHAQIVAAPTDPMPRSLLEAVSAYPDVPSLGRLHGAQAPAPVLTLVFRSKLGELRFFETITTFSMPRDVALEELRIESAFPADDATAAVCARLARQQAA
ncbi:helix-turn-helix domain-containing protein [Frateuria terrea]|uniref:Transcriptional regulator, contains XRE-family HTH domain n=1 Tax=Frateuria terrea TaxID=529704 RepID=A0A1H6XZN0_9GAMM|nr:helix-turn-helix transcriptional regulator [Frateuria terrea]SEJ33094.1 Transcriptional regulator, contains XRE-family HTH domain [Frateuria terrea]SFP51044.1 Transcriptional regulator, contains XRE-family HTH domain [Frateuria terrea]